VTDSELLPDHAAKGKTEVASLLLRTRHLFEMRLPIKRSAEKRREGDVLIREADNLACQSWNERMWSDGGPIDPSPTIDQAINGGFPGWRSSAHAARHRAMLISAPCRTSRRHACTI